MFSDSANFSGITNVDAKVDSAIQKAVIEVNEEGSVGAAASGEFLSAHSYFVTIVNY